MDQRTPVEAVRALFERAWNHQDFDTLEPSLAPTILLHWRGTTIETGLEGLERVVAAWHAAFADLRFGVEDVVADGETVAARLVQSGTHLGEWKGVAATGRSFRIPLMMFFRFEDGQMTEVWEVSDEYSLWQQLGVIGDPAEL